MYLRCSAPGSAAAVAAAAAAGVLHLSLVYSNDYAVAKSKGAGFIKILLVNLQSGKPINLYKERILFNNV